MADPLVRLDTQRASVQPGGQTQVVVTVTNPGTVVEGYQVLALGAAAPWARVVPAELSVYPQQEATATVVFSPPAGAGAPGGTIAFGVLARSTLDPRVGAVAEGDLEVGEVHGLQARLVPVTSAGRWRGRHVLQVSNSGNTAATLRFRASDPDAALGFYLQPEVVELPAGGRTSVRMAVRTLHPFLRGTPVRLPFQVVGEALDAPETPAAPTPYGDPSRPVADGALTQKPILSKAFVSLATLLVAGVAGLVAYLLLHHTPEDTLADRGSPDKPVLVATAAGPDTIALTWKPVDLVESYSLLSVDPPTGNVNGQQVVPGSQNAFSVTKLNPATPYCFQLSALRGGLTGAPSDKVCATTGAAPASPSPSPSPSPSASPTATAPASTTPTPSASASASPTSTPGDPATDPIMKQHWILVLDELPGAGVTEEMAQQRRDEFRAFVPDVQEVDRSVYPRLVFDPAASTPPAPTPGVTPEPSWLIYLGTFDTPAAATALCASIQTASGTTTCIAAQPDPLQ